MLEQRSKNPSLSDPIVFDLTADSSSEGSSGSNHLQVVRESNPVEKGIKLHKYSPPVRSLIRLVQPSNIDSTTSSPLPPLLPRLMVPDGVSSEGLIQPSQGALSEPRSSYPSLSLPAQPMVDNSEAVRASSRSKKPTKFFCDSLRHSIKLVKEAQVSQSLIGGLTQDSLSGSAPSFLPSLRKNPALETGPILT